METNKRWVVETTSNGKPEYISFIDIVGSGLKVELTEDVKKAVKYKAAFRADDDSKYVNQRLRNKPKKGRNRLKEELGDRVFHGRLLTPEEAAV